MNGGLKPCPFCGSTAVAIATLKHAIFRACCGRCGACSTARKTKEPVVEDWNQRSSPPEDVLERMAEEFLATWLAHSDNLKAIRAALAAAGGGKDD